MEKIHVLLVEDEQTLAMIIKDTLEEQAMADQLSQVWVSFARTGIPGGDGIPAWEPYTRESGATMLLDTQAELVYHHDRELMNLMAPDYVY